MKTVKKILVFIKDSMWFMGAMLFMVFIGTLSAVVNLPQLVSGMRRKYRQGVS